MDKFRARNSKVETNLKLSNFETRKSALRSWRLGARSKVIRQALTELPLRLQDLAADLDWLGVDKNESDRTGLGAAIDPIVDRAALHEHVARLQMDDRVIELHVDLARHDDGIIDRIRPVVPRRDAGPKLDDAKDRPVVQCRTDLPQSLVGVTCVIDGKRFCGPDHTGRRSGPARDEIFGNLVDLDDRAPLRIMSGDYPS